MGEASPEPVECRTQVACRLHAVLCELVAGGVADEIYAEKAASLLAGIERDSAVAAARIQLAESKKRLEQLVAASGTTVGDIFGVGPIVAATVVGLTGDIARFRTRDRFAAFNGTAPMEVSSGGRKVWRLSRRGNRTLNHAIRMAAVTELRFRHSPGRGYYDRKIAESKTPKEALRALKRRISDALWAAMVADARRAAAVTAAAPSKAGPGGQPGHDSVASAAGSHPETPALRRSHSRTRPKATTAKPRRRSSTRSTTTTARRTA